jgi:hypothetical protein
MSRHQIQHLLYHTLFENIASVFNGYAPLLWHGPLSAKTMCEVVPVEGISRRYI